MPELVIQEPIAQLVIFFTFAMISFNLNLIKFEFEAIVDYCAGVNCNYGVCQINATLATYKCVCNTGYSGATCLTRKYLICLIRFKKGIYLRF